MVFLACVFIFKSLRGHSLLGFNKECLTKKSLQRTNLDFYKAKYIVTMVYYCVTIIKMLSK